MLCHLDLEAGLEDLAGELAQQPVRSDWSTPSSRAWATSCSAIRGYTCEGSFSSGFVLDATAPLSCMIVGLSVQPSPPKGSALQARPATARI